MSDAGSLCDSRGAAETAALTRVRAVGRIGLAAAARDGTTRIARMEEGGGFRLKFPAVEGPWLEAVQLNTGGGIAGGDRLTVEVTAREHADVVVATQAPERVYRSHGPAAAITTTLGVDSGARLDWLPQETMLYSGARLVRRFEVDVAADSRLLMVEMVTFGRVASGEVMGHGLLDDAWRVRRDGRLVFAEGLRIDSDVGALLGRPAVGGGARAVAMILHVARDAGDRLEVVRSALADARSICGASAWNGMLVARFLATETVRVRRDVRLAVGALTGRPLPRVWQ